MTKQEGIEQISSMRESLSDMIRHYFKLGETLTYMHNSKKRVVKVIDVNTNWRIIGIPNDNVLLETEDKGQYWQCVYEVIDGYMEYMSNVK